jgi:HD superfamily phosphodiesterase
MLTKAAIESAERKYRSILEDFFSEIWGDTILYSHGIDHHRRVWHYAREILKEAASCCASKALISPEKLLIGCYLHDLGMASDPDNRHGIVSSRLCRKFLTRHSLDPAAYEDLTDAILRHDDKSYKATGNTLTLSTLLSVADDLDAFGYIGIYRYLEIYLARSISPETIGTAIIENASGRFVNFRTLFSDCPGLISKHQLRFEILVTFFRGNESHEPDNGAITDFVREIMAAGIPPEVYCSQAAGGQKHNSISRFCQGLCSEMEHMNQKCKSGLS